MARAMMNLHVEKLRASVPEKHLVAQRVFGRVDLRRRFPRIPDAEGVRLPGLPGLTTASAPASTTSTVSSSAEIGGLSQIEFVWLVDR
jgi:hypothetical protein